MAWIAEVSRPASMPLDQVHVALYGYFPQHAKDEARPYVWRLLSPSAMAVMSHLRPSTAAAREVFARQGMTYDFAVTYRRTRNVGGTYTRPDGERRKRQARVVEMTDHDELRERFIRYVGERGGDVRYVRIEKQRVFTPAKGVRLPICDAVGKVYVRDPALFDRLLCQGGPGQGRAYGLGMWWLPEIMEDRHAAA